MMAIGLSDSNDSSSEDVIPMQPRRKKRAFTRKKYLKLNDKQLFLTNLVVSLLILSRNSRLSTSSSFLKAHYSYGLCSLLKFIFVIFIFISIIIGIVVMYSLSKRMDSLHLSISGCKIIVYHFCFIIINYFQYNQQTRIFLMICMFCILNFKHWNKNQLI